MTQKQPSASHCFVCGVENTYGLKLAFYSQEDGRVVCEYMVSKHFQGYPGVTHGGIVAAMLDETLARALMVSDPDRFMFTARLTTRYRKPVPIGQPIRLVGEVRRERGRMAECASYLYGPDGDLLAEAEGLLVAIPPEVHVSTNTSGQSWKVYPDNEPEEAA